MRNLNSRIRVKTKVDAEIYISLHRKESGEKIEIELSEYFYCNPEKTGSGTFVTFGNPDGELKSVLVKEGPDKVKNLVKEAEETYNNLQKLYKVYPVDKRLDYEDTFMNQEVVLSQETVKDLNGKCYFDIDMFPERMEIFKLEVTDSEIIQHCAWCTSMNGDILEFSDKLSETPVKAKDTYFGSELLMIRDPDDIFLKEITPELYEEILGKIKTFLGLFNDTDKRFDTEFEPVIQKINSL
jgi:hypothetical protein